MGQASLAYRPATDLDRPALRSMTAHFLAETNYGTWLLPAGLETLITLVFELGADGCIDLAVDAATREIVGMLAIVALTHPLTNERYAEEIVWWVEPSRRNRRAGPTLLQRAEDWARAKHLPMIKMVAPIPSLVGRFYERIGYRAIETAYIKRLT